MYEREDITNKDQRGRFVECVNVIKQCIENSVIVKKKIGK